MKILIILILMQFFISVNSSAQNQYKVLDSLETTFERISRDTKIPCQFNMEFNKKENGKPFFANRDSTHLEFDFFKISSLPFYDSMQTNFETTSTYYNWILQKKNNFQNISLTKINEDEDYGYWVFKISDASGEFYRLLGRDGDIFYSIKIFDKKMSTENQLAKLQILYSLNKK